MRTLRCRKLIDEAFMQLVYKLLLGMVAFLVLLTLFERKPSAADSDKAIARRSIDLCWEDQRRKSLAPSEARFIAGACEKMEADFRQRWGRAP